MKIGLGIVSLVVFVAMIALWSARVPFTISKPRVLRALGFTMTDGTLRCWKCGYEPTVGEYLGGVSRWWPWIPAMQRVCAPCGDKEEIQLESDEVRLGYVYAAGTAHFSHMQSVRVQGLAVEKSRQQAVIRFQENVWLVPGEAQPGAEPDGAAG